MTSLHNNRVIELPPILSMLMIKIVPANLFVGYLLEISKPTASLYPLPQKLLQATLYPADFDISQLILSPPSHPTLTPFSQIPSTRW